MPISLFTDITKTTPERDASITDIIAIIKGLALADATAAIRATSDPNEQKRLKVGLPHATFAGRFSRREINGIIEPSGILCLDFDAKDNPDIQKKRKAITEDPHTLFVFTSPRGGLKVGVTIPPTTDNETFKALYAAAGQHYAAKYRLLADMQAAPISAAAFLAHDPDAFYRSAPEPFTTIEATPAPRIAGNEKKPPELDGIETIDKGNRWLFPCPQCGKKWAYLYKNGSVMRCAHRNSCGYVHRIQTAPLPLTDLGNGIRFASQCGGDAKYCPDKKKWLVWDGTRWAHDTAGDAKRLAKGVALSLYTEAANTRDPKAAAAISKWATSSQSKQRIDAMLAMAESEDEASIREYDLDSDKWKLNLSNCTINLKTGDIYPHNPEDYITKRIDIPYDREARCPMFLDFLHQIMLDRKALVNYLQKFIGYCLTGCTNEQIFSVWYGTGMNGKSTLLNIIARLLGDDYHANVQSDTLSPRNRPGIPNDIARLRGTRLVIASETNEGQRLDESLIKQMTGGDKLSARFMFAEFFEFKPEFKIVMLTNHKPTIRGTDHAIWRRIHLVPFDFSVTEETKKDNLEEELAKELPGIMQWAIAGCAAWQNEGLGKPEEIKAAVREYRDDQDQVARFLADCCEARPEYVETFSALYKKYTEWAKETGEHYSMSAKKFSESIQLRGGRQTRTRDRKCIAGFEIITGNAQQSEGNSNDSGEMF